MRIDYVRSKADSAMSVAYHHNPQAFTQATILSMHHALQFGLWQSLKLYIMSSPIAIQGKICKPITTL